MQWPFWHVDGARHSVPQTPQLLLSAVRSVQVPAQSVYGAPQTHEPLEHVRFPPQVAMQLPQLALLVIRFAQAAPRPTPHWVVGARHVMTHVLSEQSGVAPGHALPHAPQLALFEVK